MKKRQSSHNLGVPELNDVYLELEEAVKQESEIAQEKEQKLVTYSCDDMPFSMFARFVSDTTGVSIIADVSLYEKRIDLDVVGVELDELLSNVARALGTEITRSGNLYFVGELRPEDRAVMVRKVVRLKRDELRQAVGLMLSDNGKAATYDDGLVVVADKIQVITRIQQMLQSIEVAEIDTWVVQLYLISVGDRQESEVGVDLKPVADMSFAFATASADVYSGVKMLTSLQAILKATREIEDMSVVAQPLFVLTDGKSSKIRDAQDIPVPKKAITDAGTVSTTGYENVSVGLEVETTVRDVGERRAMLDVKVELSDLVGYVDQIAPIKKTQNYETSLVINSGGVYMIGELQQDKTVNTKSSILQTVRKQEVKSNVIQVWARAYKIVR
ncbi:hypothetical protein JD969_15125 [Planctomycetota bacterium]|nr:hypothetical protein JD969_15125 [Planctomycetota bacterium]